jgi:glycosyltransferase involved in cell wall biosynthesis
MRCRLLYVVGQLGYGGLERQLCYLLEGMDRSQYRPAVVAWTSSDAEAYVARIRALDVPLLAFTTMPSRAAKLAALRRLVRLSEPEIVHSYTFFTNFAAYWAVRGTRSRALGSIRCDFAHEMTTTGPCLSRLSARWPSDQICNSSLGAENARRWRSPFVPRRVFVVHNGVDLETFSSVKPRASGKIRIVGVGSLVARKRWERLLRATQHLTRRGYDFEVRIVGDGPMRAPLTHQAHVLGIADRVQFSGYCDDIPGLLTDATFVVHTSDREGYPNVVMEAMASGRAVVATDAGDVPAMVQDGTTGFVVRRGDDEALCAGIERLMTDPDLCRRMGEAGRAQAERQFPLQRFVSDTLAAYRAVGWTGS